MTDEKSERWKLLGQLASGISLPTDPHKVPGAIPFDSWGRIRGRRRLRRNDRIMELKARGASYLTIAKALDREGYPPPAHWGVKKFKEACQDADLRDLFQKMCSVNKPRKSKYLSRDSINPSPPIPSFSA